MEVVATSWAISRAKLQSNHHHQQTNTQLFYNLDALPVTQPTVSEHWRKNITFHGLAHPKLISGLPTLSLTTKGSWFTLGEGCHASHQPSDASTPALVHTVTINSAITTREIMQFFKSERTYIAHLWHRISRLVILGNCVGTRSAEHDKIEQWVGTESVSTVHRDTGRFTGTVETSYNLVLSIHVIHHLHISHSSGQSVCTV